MIKEKAAAKINFGLQVINKRMDGYHNLKTIMIPINLYDWIYIYSASVFKLQSNWDVGPIKSNLVFRTYSYMKDKYKINKEMNIVLKKNIPIGAGLGGGSADAAATIRALNRFWELNLSNEEMENIAVHIGSDVPFCIQNKSAIATSRGEELTHIDYLPPFYVALIVPPYSSYTKDVFSGFNIQQEDNRFDKLLDCLKSRKTDLIKDYLFNDLESKVNFMQQDKLPSILEMKNKLLDVGCIATTMSGSGSSVYGIFLNPKNKRKIKQDLTAVFPKCQIFIVDALIK